MESKAIVDSGLKLLNLVCSKDDLKDWEQNRGVWVQGPTTKRWYFVTVADILYCPDKTLINPMRSYCVTLKYRTVTPRSPWPPWEITTIDLIIAKKLLIQCDERYFLQIARS